MAWDVYCQSKLVESWEMPWQCPLLDVSHWSVPPGECLFGENSMELDTKQPWFLLACSSCSSWPWFSFFLQLQVQVENLEKFCGKTSTSILDSCVSNMDPAAKPAWMRHQALQSYVCHQLRHLESPSAFAEICQATIHLGLRPSFGARGSARWWCEPGMSPDVLWKSRWFPVDGRSCLYPMIDACSRALTNMEGLFVHSGQTLIFLPTFLGGRTDRWYMIDMSKLNWC